MSLFLKSLKETGVKIVDVLPSRESTLYIIVEDEKGEKCFVKYYIGEDCEEGCGEVCEDDCSGDVQTSKEIACMSKIKDLNISPQIRPLPTKVRHISTKYFKSEHIVYGEKFDYGPEIVRVYKIIAKAGILYTDCKLRNMILEDGKLLVIDWDDYFIIQQDGISKTGYNTDELLACMLFQFLAIQLLVFDRIKYKVDGSAMSFIWNELHKYNHVFHGIWRGAFIAQYTIHRYLLQTEWNHSMHISPSRLKMLTRGGPKRFGVYYQIVGEILNSDIFEFKDPRGILIESEYTFPVKKVKRITY